MTEVEIDMFARLMDGLPAVAPGGAEADRAIGIHDSVVEALARHRIAGSEYRSRLLALHRTRLLSMRDWLALGLPGRGAWQDTARNAEAVSIAASWIAVERPEWLAPMRADEAGVVEMPSLGGREAGSACEAHCWLIDHLCVSGWPRGSAVHALAPIATDAWVALADAAFPSTLPRERNSTVDEAMLQKWLSTNAPQFASPANPGDAS